MDANPSPDAMSAAMLQAGFRRQFHLGGWRVAWWPATEHYPQRMPNSVADRRAMLRTATRLKRPPYSEALWQALLMSLPAIASHKEFEVALGETAESLHARFDNLDLVGGETS
jgi:hypothetical protein